MMGALKAVDSMLSEITYSTEDSSWHSLDVELTEQDEFNETHYIFMITTPINEPLSARYFYSFAFRTFRLRSPQIINDLIRSMQENENWIIAQCGSYAHFDLRRVVWSLTILRNEILENREFKLFHDKEPDSKEWNMEIKRLVNREKNRWFTCMWLFAECYLYRRIWIAFRRAETLKNFDYFSPEKFGATRSVVSLMGNIVRSTRNLPRSQCHLQLMLKLSLWGNRCDLSITSATPSELMLEIIAEHDKDLIVDQSADVWHLLTDDTDNCSLVVDIVLDNAGYELFTDLLLAAYLLDTKLAKKVRFHVKNMPWFISDVTANDFNWMISFFLREETPELTGFGLKLKKYLQHQALELCSNSDFWTKPKGFRHMRQLSPCLYVQLSLGDLVIFKGDLNYRKLLDDINYCSTTPFADCLGGFMPTSVCALRVIKSDIYCGMPVCAVEWLTEDNSSWMVQAEKAVIQLAVKPRP